MSSSSSLTSYYSNGNGSSSNTVLGRCLGDILNVIRPLQGDVTARNAVINDLRAVVVSIPCLRGATVEPFGSFVSNLYTRWGDLDISIELPCGDFVSATPKNKKQKFLREITKVLRWKGVVQNIQLILQARVPLLVYESNLHFQKISCDISISNQMGQIKSKLFLWLTGIDARFRDMVLLIKEWAKAQQINDPKNGTLNSYSLCFLVIFHLQTCEPAIFPPLKDIYAGNIVKDLSGSRVAAERNIHDTCIANIEMFRRNSFRNLNQSSLSELLISFFQKFSDISRRAAEYAICTYTGQWKYRSYNDPKTNEHPLLIEDPFEMPENAARAVSMSQLPRISEAFARTHRLLVSSNQDRNSLICGLVGLRVSSQLIASHSNPMFSSGAATNFPPLLSRAVPSPQTSQNQFYNRQFQTSPSPSPSVSVRRPVATTHFKSQQQRWEPKTTTR